MFTCWLVGQYYSASSELYRGSYLFGSVAYVDIVNWWEDFSEEDPVAFLLKAWINVLLTGEVGFFSF